MRKIVFAFTLLLFFACNSKTENKNGPAGSESVLNAEPKQATTEINKPVSGACGKLIFFRPGAEIEAKTYNANAEEVATQTTKILDVINEDGFMVAHVEGADVQAGSAKPTTVRYSYKCDGNKIYFDIASLFRTDEKNNDTGFESSLIDYPVNVKEGDELPEATGTMKAERNGKKMEMKYRFINRKVEGKEDVTTPAGTWNCFKISHETRVEMNLPGMDEKTKSLMQSMQDNMKMKTITWLAPDFGIVKMEMYSNDKLTSRNEVTAVKK